MIDIEINITAIVMVIETIIEMAILIVISISKLRSQFAKLPSQFTLKCAS
jgi:hypothetical protein